MTRKVKGIIFSRLIVLMAIILVPIAEFIIFNLIDFEFRILFWVINDPEAKFWIIKILSPTVFSVSWLFFLILFSDRFAKTLDSMDHTVSFIPLRLKLFYGIVSIIFMFILVFPLITPIVSVLSFMSMAWRLTTYKKEDWENTDISFFTKFFMGVAAILPLFCSIIIIPQYLILATSLINFMWQTPIFFGHTLIQALITFSYSLCTALAIGSFFILLANKGVSEYEQLYPDAKQNRSIWHIRLLELGLTGFFLYLSYGGFQDIAQFFYYTGFVVVVLVSIINYFSGKQKSKKFSGHVFGYILAALFMGSSLLTFNVTLSSTFSIIMLIILAGIFIFVFIYTFLKIEEFSGYLSD